MKDLRKYPLKYGVQIGEWSIPQELDKDTPFADKVVYIPIRDMGPKEDNKKYFACFSVDGETREPVTDQELWEVLVFLIKLMADQSVLEAWQVELLQYFSGKIEKMIAVSKIIFDNGQVHEEKGEEFQQEKGSSKKTEEEDDKAGTLQ